MKYDFSHDAIKAFGKLDSNTAGRIIKGIMGLPDRGQIKALTGDLEGKMRLRVGDWRIIYTIENGTVLIGHILPRGDAYKK
jgi:mRNA interferase RelE/StbE